MHAAGSDYGVDGDPIPPVITPISIPSGLSSVDILIPIINDDCREVDEMFIAVLTVIPNQNLSISTLEDQLVITIEDDDGKTI